MIGLRTLQRASRAPSLRQQLVRKRWESSHSGPQLEGVADNAFNRERAAVKEHAAETSGT